MNRWRGTRAAILACWLVSMLGCAWLAIFATPVVTQISQFIPRNDPATDLLDDLYASVAARIILIGISGDTGQERAAVSARLAQSLRAGGLFVRVVNGPSSLTEEVIDRLFGYRYLLSPTVSDERFREANLRQALQQRLQELSSPLSVIGKQFLPSDPTGEFRSMLGLFQGGVRQPATRSGVWFSTDGSEALLLAETHASGFDPEAQAPAIAAIEAAFSEAKGGSAVTLAMTGPGVIADLTEQRITSEAAVLGLASLSFIVLMISIAYRSLRLVLLSPVPIISAVLVSVVGVGILYGGIHGIVLGFGATLIGVVDDYPIHLFSHLTREETADHTLKRIWPTLRLSVLSTAIGYLAMISTNFTSLAQVGVFSLLGLITAAAVTRWVLPALLPHPWAPHISDPLKLPPRLPRFSPRLPASMPIIAGCVLLLALTALLLAKPPRWESDFTALSPVPKTVLAQDARLRRELGAPEAGQIIFIRATTPEAALQRSEVVADQLRDLQDRGLLTGFETASRYLPSQATQEARRAALPDPERLRADLAAALAGLPFRQGLFEPFLRDVERARADPPVTLADLQKTPLATAVNALLYPGRGGWTTMVLLSGVTDAKRLAEAVAGFGDADVHYLDFRATTTRMASDLRDGALGRLAVGATILVAMLVICLRSWHRVVVVVVPLLLAILITVGVFAVAGVPLTIFHLVSLLLVAGLGIDYGLFFSQVEPDAESRRRTLHALLVCSSSTIIGFGVLCFSSIPVLSAIGQTVALGVISAFVFSALIAGPCPRSSGV